MNYNYKVLSKIHKKCQTVIKQLQENQLLLENQSPQENQHKSKFNNKLMLTFLKEIEGIEDHHISYINQEIHL